MPEQEDEILDQMTAQDNLLDNLFNDWATTAINTTGIPGASAAINYMWEELGIGEHISNYYNQKLNPMYGPQVGSNAIIYDYIQREKPWLTTFFKDDQLQAVDVYKHSILYNTSPYGEKLAETAVNMLGHNIVMNPTSDYPEGRTGWVCVDAINCIIKEAGLEQYIPRDEHGNMSSNNLWVADALNKHPDWQNMGSNINTKDGGPRNVQPGDWVQVYYGIRRPDRYNLSKEERNIPFDNQTVYGDDLGQGHSMMVIGTDEYGVYFIDEAGDAGPIKRRFEPWEYLEKNVRDIWRLMPHNEQVTEQVLKDINF